MRFIERIPQLPQETEQQQHFATRLTTRCEQLPLSANEYFLSQLLEFFPNHIFFTEWARQQFFPQLLKNTVSRSFGKVTQLAVPTQGTFLRLHHGHMVYSPDLPFDYTLDDEVGNRKVTAWEIAGSVVAMHEHSLHFVILSTQAVTYAAENSRVLPIQNGCIIPLSCMQEKIIYPLLDAQTEGVGEVALLNMVYYVGAKTQLTEDSPQRAADAATLSYHIRHIQKKLQPFFRIGMKKQRYYLQPLT